MRSWRTHVQIAAPVQEVWDVLVDSPHSPIWNPGVRPGAVAPSGPLARGTTVEVGGGSRTVLTVDECNPPRFLKLRVTTGKTTGESHFVLHPAGNDTILEHTLHLELKGFSRFFALFIGRSLKNEFSAMRRRIEERFD